MKLEYRKILEKFDSELPHFEDGRINYKNAKQAMVISVSLKSKDKYLLLKRSQRVATHQEKWDVLGGYVDAPDLTIEDQVYIELREELEIHADMVRSLIVGDLFRLVDRDEGMIWYVIPVLVTLNTEFNINLDWEHSESAWVLFNELDNYDLTIGVKAEIEKWENR